MQSPCVIGIDYGTQSARALAVSLADGHPLGEAVYPYPHGVMTQALPDGTPLPGEGWALAHPQDYWDALTCLIPQTLAAAALPAEAVQGIAIAATACSLLPVDASLRPLCLLPDFLHEPHAYLKLWKHHRAEPDARHMTEAARAQGASLLDAYGGAVSPEWAMPKMLEVQREAPRVCQEASCFMQVSDWLDSLLTGRLTRSGGIAAFKALYDRQRGYPSRAYLDAAGNCLGTLVQEKLRGDVCWPGQRIGALTPASAKALGLLAGTAVASGHTDAHAAALGAGVCRSGDYLVVLGTSSVTHFLHSTHRIIPGISGAIAGGLLPGLTCYTAGQPCAGDMLGWFVQSFAPTGGPEAYKTLEDAAAHLAPGENGLMALDWWNGNRSILANSRLRGALLGLTLRTSPADIYRALLESIAFGQRMIRDQYVRHGLRPERIILCGGMAQKSPLLCQLMADVLAMPVEIAGTPQATALGAAMCAAAAVDPRVGGCATLAGAVERLRAPIACRLTPDDAHRQPYEALFALFARLHNLLGIDHADIMEALAAGLRQD